MHPDSRQSRVFTPADKVLPDYRIPWLTRFAYGNPFEFTIVGIIILNAFFLATLTLPDINPTLAQVARTFDQAVIWLYVAELVVRIASYGKKPWMFFTAPWNVFDFLVLALIPVFSGQTVILRLLRLLRVVRIFRFLPEVRILTNSITRSLPPLASVSVLIMFLLFIYAMAGHYLFGQALPDHWGDVAKAMESLFILLTLENFPNYFEEAMAVTPAALLFFLSYVFIIVFTILNVLIGIVINAMDEAREEERQKSDTSTFAELDRLIAEIEQDESVSPESMQQVKDAIAQLKSPHPHAERSSGSKKPRPGKS